MADLRLADKIQIRRLPVTYKVSQGEQSIIYPGLGEWSDWGEDIYAGYLNYIREMPLYDIEGRFEGRTYGCIL